MQSEVEMNKIVIFGGTGYIGKFIVEASVKLGHPTYVYARPIPQQSTSTKIQVHNHFKSLGVTIIQGELDEHEKIVALLSEVDIVISALAYPQVMEQLKILDAIKAAGNIKRFIPSDFGCEEDRTSPLPPFEKFLEKKRKIRRSVEASGTPYTYVAANCYGAYFVNLLLRPYDQPSAEEVTVFGTGEAKVVLNYEEDIGMYTIKVANDPRACNKVVHFRMPKTIVSQLELISLWENKIGRTINKIYVSEEDLVKRTQSLSEPENIPMAILHSIFVRGDLVSYELGEDDLEASNLYPDYDYTTIDALLRLFLLSKAPKPIIAAFQ